jgi:hypothetical protein
MVAKLTRLTHKIAIQLHLVAELYHLQFSFQVASLETFGYTLVCHLKEIKSNYERLYSFPYYTVLAFNAHCISIGVWKILYPSASNTFLM